MEGRKHLAAIRTYCDYIDRHLSNVEKSWSTLQEACKGMRFIYDDYVWGSIDEEVKRHDLSKFSAQEFIQYQQCFVPVEGAEKRKLGDAWEHHKSENDHHWQTWASREYGNPYAKEVHCVHMVIDWMAMGLEFGNTAESYYRDNESSIEIPDWAREFLGEIFDCLSEHNSTLLGKEGENEDPY